MSDLKRICPGCDAYTSSVGIAFRDGEPCPHCHLPWTTAKAVEKARTNFVAEETVLHLIAAEKRASEAEAKLREQESIVAAVRAALSDNDE